MACVVVSLVFALRSAARSRAALHLEILALRHQLAVLESLAPSRLRLTAADRALWAWLSQAWSGWRPALILIKPDTVLAWHRRRFRLFWTWKRRSRTGRPAAAVGAYALLALMVAAVGLYGLLSHMVGTRQREIGIRLVLSAQIRSVRSLVVREGAVLAVAGVIVGLGAALAATRALSTLLYGVSAHDPFLRSRGCGAARDCVDRQLVARPHRNEDRSDACATGDA